MSERIFFSYGVEVFRDLLGYKVVFENGGHGGGLRTLRVTEDDAQKLMAGADAAAEVLGRLDR